jgi:amino acid adenylation domain-containing protein
MSKNIESIYPLSPLQEGLLFHSLYDPEAGLYFTQLQLVFTGEFKVSAFKRAWQQVLDRHPILRTFFIWKGRDKPLQIVRQRVTLPWDERDWRDLSAREQEENSQIFLESDRHRGFTLSEAPLMRFLFVCLAEDKYQFIWSHHHLLLDGWSLSLLLKEVSAWYENISQNQQLSAEPVRPYQDFIAWIERQDLSEAEIFWRRMLSGFERPINLGIDRVSSILPNVIKNHAVVQILLPATTTEALESMVRKHHLTLSTLVQGAWALFLSRYSGEEDVMFGTVSSGRPVTLRGVETMVGLFINTLPMRVRISPEISCLQWLKKVQDQQIEMRQYEYSSLSQIQGWSEVPRGVPLFETILAFENYPVDKILQKPFGGMQIQEVRVIERTNYPIFVQVNPGSELRVTITYDCHRFQTATINRMLGHFQTLLKGIADNPSQRLSDLSLLTEAERQQLLVERNDTATEYPQDKSIQELFEEQVARLPEADAVICKCTNLSYGELNKKANQLASYLRELGIGPGVFVGVCMERSVDMAIALLGVLKAGGAYVPLDPHFPADRIEFMLEDSHSGVLITQSHLRGDIGGFSGVVVCLDSDWEAISKERDGDPATQAGPDDLAYVIYTSGSTGKPKGVQISHRALVNFLCSMQREPGMTAADSLLSVTTMSFDIFGLELYLPLITGARVVMAERDDTLDGSRLTGLLKKHGVTVMQATPSTWRLLIESGWSGHGGLKALCGGEAFPPDLVGALLERCRELWNLYGPTETTIWSTVHRIESEEAPVSIGHPIANTQVYILDKTLQLVPTGVVGELHIGGDGLSRGYLNRPELTAERFIAHPFIQEPGARIYKTGDLARYRPDGTIECLGRIDHQVKLRGFRIELGEIEASLKEVEGVGNCVVVLREDRPGDHRLVAYYVRREGVAVPLSKLRSHLQLKLPDYMVPQHFMELSSIPLTPNGKVDRKALPKPEADGALEQGYVAPRTDTEEKVAAIWQEVLNCGKVGVHDNFFELGGHSLLATRIISLVNSEFNIELPLRSLFESPTVSSLAEAIALCQTEQANSETLARVLADVERLSSDEVKAMLVLDSKMGETEHV